MLAHKHPTGNVRLLSPRPEALRDRRLSSAPQAAAGPLLERDDQLQAIALACAAARGGSGNLILVDGPAGVGKTALLEAARSAATDAGLSILGARGAELEHEFAFGIVRQ